MMAWWFCLALLLSLSPLHSPLCLPLCILVHLSLSVYRSTPAYLCCPAVLLEGAVPHRTCTRHGRSARRSDSCLRSRCGCRLFGRHQRDDQLCLIHPRVVSLVAVWRRRQMWLSPGVSRAAAVKLLRHRLSPLCCCVAVKRLHFVCAVELKHQA